MASKEMCELLRKYSKQGWTDETLFELFLEFISQHNNLGELEKFLDEVARKENEG